METTIDGPVTEVKTDAAYELSDEAAKAELARFLEVTKLLLSNCEGNIELRALKPDEKTHVVERIWSRKISTIGDFCAKHNGVNHVLYSASTRKPGGGKKIDCVATPMFWADIDFKDFVGGKQEASERLQAYSRPPSKVVATGGGFHCYWYLAQPLKLPKHRKDVERALKQLVKELGADPTRAEIASMLRVPGTRNMKPERQGFVARIEAFEPSRRYELSQFLPPTTTVSFTPDSSPSLKSLAAAIKQGNRDSGALAYVNKVIKSNGTAVDDEKLLAEVTDLLVAAGGEGLDAIIQKIPGWIKTAHEHFDTGYKRSCLQLAEAIRASYDNRVVSCGGQLRIYRDGYWPLADEHALRKQIAECDRPFTTPNRTTQALQNLKDLTHAENFHIRADLICLANGTLDPASGQLLPHDPSHCLVNRLNIAWDAGAPHELWSSTLNEIFQGDPEAPANIDLIQAWFGYSLVPETRYHKFMWYVGNGANGKSVILEMQQAILGQHNCAHLMLNRLGRDFVRVTLQDKLLNISSEMRAEDTVQDSLLKAIAAGDMIEAEIKYGPSISFRPTARIVAATNELPRLLDTSEGFRRRIMLIRFPRVFAEHEQDRERVAKLTLELPGILRVGSSRVDLQACKLEYSIVSPK